MDSSILKILGQIAGIGGISIGVFLILFREVIRKNIFPDLNKKDAYNLLKLIVILIWSIAILGIIAYTYLSVDNKISTKSVSDIKIIEIGTENRSVEFKIKNKGNDSAYITGIKFNSIPKLLDNNCAFVPPHIYKYKIDNLKSDFKIVDFNQTLSLSQVVPPKSVDRFKIIFNIEPDISCADLVYLGNATIYYDGEKKLNSHDFKIVFVKLEN